MKTIQTFLQHNYKILFFLVCTVSLLFTNLINKPLAFHGDYPEYLITTEAISNHFSPDIRAEDAQRVSDNLYPNTRHKTYLGLKHYIETNNKQEPGYFLGIIKTKRGSYFAMHFWFYSLINIPAKVLLESLNSNPYLCFRATNILLILLLFLYILFYSKIDEKIKIPLSIIFFFAGIQYYVAWIHPEVYTAVLTLFSFIALYDKRFKLSIILVCLASFQNPPLVFIIVFAISYNWYLYGFNLKRLFYLSLIGSICLIPFIFNYYHFGALSSVESAVKYEYISLARLHSTFFDVNQGVIVSIPILLLLFIYFTIKNLISKNRSFFDFTFLIVILISIPTLAQTNWNMGHNFISRYVLWISVPIIFYTCMQLMKIKRGVLYLWILLLIQIPYVSIYHSKQKSYLANKPLAKFLLIHHPSLYNPDPEIFGERTLHHERVLARESPVVYLDNKSRATKIMVHKSRLSELDLEQITPNYNSEYIQKQLNNLTFVRDWAYINLK